MGVQYAIPTAAFCLVLSITLIARNFLLAWLRRLSAVSTGARVITALWCAAASLLFALPYTAVAGRTLDRVENWTGAFLIASVTFALAELAVQGMTRYGRQHVVPFADSGMSRTLVRVVVLGAGAILLLTHFGKSVTGILTALGIGGLAIALALQDTLANFFAGVHILIETPIRLGDHIRLSSGEEGVVTDIGWRTTRVLTGGHSTIVIPNTKITSGILTNFSLPESRVSVEVPIYLDHSADVNRVAEMALDTAAETGGVLSDPVPSVLFDPGFLPTHLELKAVLGVASPAQRSIVASEFRVRLLEKLAAAGIRLPAGDRFAWAAAGRGRAAGSD